MRVMRPAQCSAWTGGAPRAELPVTPRHRCGDHAAVKALRRFEPVFGDGSSWQCGSVMNGAGSPVALSELAEWVQVATKRSSLLVAVTAVDGPGGAGKSTFAARLSEALGGVPIVHTDEFASWDDPLDWWPRLIEQVLAPLAAGTPARYQPYNWVTRSLDGWIDVDARHIILEGVSANRLAFSPYVAFAIWIETSREARLARGLERDGTEMLEQWNAWMAAEDDYVARESPKGRSDLVISGEPTIAGHSDGEVLLLRRGRGASGT